MTRRILFSLAACVLLAGGCRVHEVPTDGGDGNAAVVDLTLSLKLDKGLPQYRDIPIDSKAGESYQARYVVALFRYASETPNAKPDYIFAFQESEMTDQSFTVKVAPMNYKVLAWVDYVNGTNAFYTGPIMSGDTDLDQSYNRVSLAEGAYIGNSPWHDAYYCAQDVKLSSYLANRSQHTMEVELTRPHAHFNFVATDKDQFIKHVTSKGTSEFDISDFKVKVSYPQFLPCTFDLFADKPVDSRSGVEFTINPTLLSDGNVEIGGDWVFAESDKTHVIVTLSFYDAKGKFISSLNNIEIPLCRGKNTTVKGALLTNGVNDGISIDPSFDGDIVVNL